MGRYGQWNALKHPLNLALAAAQVWLNWNDFDKKITLKYLICIIFRGLHGCQNTFQHTLTTPDGPIKKTHWRYQDDPKLPSISSGQKSHGLQSLSRQFEARLAPKSKNRPPDSRPLPSGAASVLMVKAFEVSIVCFQIATSSLGLPTFSSRQ